MNIAPRFEFSVQDFNTWADVERNLRDMLFEHLTVMFEINLASSQPLMNHFYAVLWIVTILKKNVRGNQLPYVTEILDDIGQSTNRSFVNWKAKQKKKCYEAGGVVQWWATTKKKRQFAAMKPLLAKTWKNTWHNRC